MHTGHTNAHLNIALYFDQLQHVHTSLFCFFQFGLLLPRPGSVVVERLPGMREVGGSIPGRVKQKMLKFQALLSAQHKRVRDRLVGSESE